MHPRGAHFSFLQMLDMLLPITPLLTLPLLTLPLLMLPLLTLQSSVLFRSQNFARVIAKKLRHADLLERILS